MCYGRSIEVRKIGKLSLERHKGGRDRLIEVAAQSTFYFPLLQASFLQLFRVVDYWPLNGEWLLNRWPLNGGLTVYRVG